MDYQLQHQPKKSTSQEIFLQFSTTILRKTPSSNPEKGEKGTGWEPPPKILWVIWRQRGQSRWKWFKRLQWTRKICFLLRNARKIMHRGTKVQRQQNLLSCVSSYSPHLFLIISPTGLNANIQCMKHLEVRKMKVAKLRAPIPSLLNRTNTTKLHVRFNVQFFRWRGNGSSAASISSSASTNIPSLSSFAPSSAGEKKQFLEFLMYYQRKKSLRMVQELIEEKVEEENSFENREDTGGLLESFVWFCFLSTEIPVWSFFGERK